ILKEVDRIWRKHKIKYLLDAGTLIGAIRHKGFIPWDDDVDIAFMRADYEKFIKVAPGELSEDIHLLLSKDIGGGKVFYDFTPKLVYKKSRKTGENEETRFYGNELNHICVDLFIIDDISENKFSRTMQVLLMKMVYGLAMGHRWKLDYSKYKGLAQAQVRVLASIGKCIPMEKIYRLEAKMAIRQNKQNSRLCYYSNYDPGYTHMLFKKAWSEHVINVKFEGYELMAPKGYDKVLKTVYGEYMTPPPEDKRAPSHGDLEDEGFYVL
ncbi:MAG: LicD family protein, partial [Clostridiales bacterium]|nr:LicD family protein [Clostridiales bacterium]